ncbi:MAG: C-terminal helicase domain-containing protein [Candidatus Abyssubacteria bacterium]|nr:C-terminal helicase domain-containing protein [Candidatus Abyssubacteria bacterium]
MKTLSELLRKPRPGIIYTATRRQCEDVNRFLQELGKSSDYYHAGRSAAVRVEVHERFLRNEIEVIAATNAFGMGVDKPDIRFIIHYAHPASIDTYYQEIGRGGRDGGRCDCILLFSRYDRKVQERFIFDSTPAAELVEECFSHVMTNAERSGELSISRRFHESHNIELFEMEKAGILNRRPVMGGAVSIYLSSEFENALDLSTARQRSVLLDLDRCLNLSRRGYATEVDLTDLQRKFFPDTKVFELEQTLLQMNARGIIAYRPGSRTICYSVRVENVSGELMKRIEESASGRRAFKMRRLETMTGYAALRSCLRRYLLDMLGDAFPKPQCGFCDNCL